MKHFRNSAAQFFKDKDGRIVIWQTPNVPLVGWILFTTSTHVLHTAVWQHFASYMSFGFIFMWAWLEITTGKSNFRRVLGIVVLAASLNSLLR